jgi:hypothetical protein
MMAHRRKTFPAFARTCHGRDLAAALASAKLPEKEAWAWRRDLKAARKKLKPPTDRWR